MVATITSNIGQAGCLTGVPWYYGFDHNEGGGNFKDVTATCGDDLSLIMTHTHGCDAQEVHAFAWDVFTRTTKVAQRLGLHRLDQM